MNLGELRDKLRTKLKLPRTAVEEIEARADVLVTGDAALLTVTKRAPRPIVNPRGLWELLRGPSR